MYSREIVSLQQINYVFMAGPDAPFDGLKTDSDFDSPALKAAETGRKIT
jgi:hypothetical protein